MHPELQIALTHLYQGLPFTPRWVGVISVDGVQMGFYGLEPKQEDRATGMLAASDALHSRISKELDNGAFRYAIVAAQNGILITLVYPDVAVVGINAEQIPSFDKFFQDLPAALAPLLKLLGLK
jgi:hypothetical protein